MTRAELPHLLKLDPAIPRDLATIVHKAIARDPADRYPTAGDLAADLTRSLEDRPIRARRLSPLGVAWRWARRNKQVSSLLGLVAALMVAFSVGAMVAAERYRAVALKETKLVLPPTQPKAADTHARGQPRSGTSSTRTRPRPRRSSRSWWMIVLGAASPSKTRARRSRSSRHSPTPTGSAQGKFAKEPQVEASIRQAPGAGLHRAGRV